VRKLLPQQVRHRAPALLVRLRDLRAVGRTRVPGDGDAARGVVREQLEEHVREAEQGVRRLPVRRLELLREREVRPVREVVAVDEEERGALCRPVVELELLPGQRLRAHAVERNPPPRALVRADDRRASGRTARGAPPGSPLAVCPRRPPFARPTSCRSRRSTWTAPRSCSPSATARTGSRSPPSISRSAA